MLRKVKHACCSIKSVNADDWSGRAVIAMLGVADHDGDLLARGSVGTQTAVLLPTHSWDSVPLGRAVVKEIGSELVAEFRFNPDIEDARAWFSALKFDFEFDHPLQEWSFGFLVKESRKEFRDGRYVRVIDELTVVEVSPVLLGAGVGTHTECIGGTCKTRKHSKELQQFDEDVENSLASTLALKVRETIEKSQAMIELLKSMETVERTKQLTDFFYLELLPHAVPTYKREFAQLIVAKLSQTWQIPTPTVKWFSPETDEERKWRFIDGEPNGEGFHTPYEVSGMARPDCGEVWISADVDGPALERVAVHETLHVRFPAASEEQIIRLDHMITSS